MHNVHINTVSETDYFFAKASKLLTAEEYEDLIVLLATDPQAGDIIQGTGGIRKVRLARRGGGKRGGYRVIYFYYDANHPILLLDVFAKNQQANLTSAQIKQLAGLVKQLKHELKSE